jgi:hypothetical protein
MNARWITVISVGLNLALVAGIVKVSRRGEPAAVPEIRAMTNRAAAMAAEALPVPVPAPLPEPMVEDFQWPQAADADFKKYRENLEALECPENAAQVILLAEINAHYGEKRRAALAAVQGQFWDLMVQGPDALVKKAEAATRGIDDERKKVIEEVVGARKPDEAELAANKKREAAARQAQYAWLAEEKREKMMVLDKKLEEATAEMWRVGRQNKDRQPTAEAKARQKEVEQQIKQERQQLLTTEEFSEYELRSAGAASWAAGATGFEPTEAEWRQVTKLQKQRDDALAEMDANKPANDAEKKARAEATQRLNEEYNKSRDSILGPERAAELTPPHDRDYRQVLTVTKRFGLDDAVAMQVYELQRVAMQQATALRNNKSIEADSREAAMQAIRRETERTLAQAMGARAFATYQKYDEGWFSRLQGR